MGVGESLNSMAKIVSLTKEKQHFFGYYDKCPWDKNGKYILALEADFIDRLPNANDAARIGIIDLEKNNVFRIVSQTKAWNWQQGAMLQWLGPDYERRIIFNDFQNSHFVSVVLDVHTSRKRLIPSAIYAVHPSGKYALSLNFSRLDDVREGYGYKGVGYTSEKKLDDDGIYLVNLEMGHANLMVPLSNLLEYQFVSSMNESRHWVDHLTFSPSGTRFAFLHRWQLKNGGMHSRLYVARFESEAHAGKHRLTPRILLDSGMASHFTWRGDGELLVWGRPSGVSASIGRKKWARKILVPIYHRVFSSSPALRQEISGDAFMLFNVETGAYKKIGVGALREDGHCSFSPDGQWLMTDTYPSKNHYRKLLLFHLTSNKLIEVQDFFSLPDKRYGIKDDWDSSAMLCDLHPRWNRDGTQVCIDSVHEGSRQIYILALDSLI